MTPPTNLFTTAHELVDEESPRVLPPSFAGRS
jgi:hypothetical protein